MKLVVAVTWMVGALTAAGPAAAQEWAVRLDAGQAEIHRAGSGSWLLAGAIGREAARGRSRLELGLAMSPADEGYLAATAGLELRLLPRSAVAPIGAVHLGILGEPENVGWAAGASAGVRVRVSRAVALRGVVTRGTHAGASGPNTFMAGVELLAGSPTAPVGDIFPVPDTLRIRSIERITGRQGVEQDGRYKITIPQNDLDVRVDGFDIIPPMGMGSWVTFAPAAGGAVVMGDVVVREDEIAPVQRVLVEHGLTVTALHNHFVRAVPRVMYMHIGGVGSEETLARGVDAVFDAVAKLRGGDPSAAEAGVVANTLDTNRIARMLGHEGEMSRGVYKVTIGRPDVSLTTHGVPVTSFMGFNTWAAWQGTPEHAAVAGDFAMLAHEVEHVIETLVESGIDVVAVHNHMVQEDPRIFFLHYWGTGPAEQLALGLRAALDRTGTGADRHPGSQREF